MHDSRRVIHNKFYELLSVHTSDFGIYFVMRASSTSDRDCRVVFRGDWTRPLSFARQHKGWKCDNHSVTEACGLFSLKTRFLTTSAYIGILVVLF